MENRIMKDSRVEWIGEYPSNWKLLRVKNLFTNHKLVVGSKVNDFERLALTLNGVIKRSKEDNEGLQPTEFTGYQILRENELVFKLIDLQNISTSRVGISPFNGIVSPAYIVLKANHVEAKFGYYFFYSMWQRDIFNQLGDAGVRSSLNASELLNLPIVCPSIPEQCKISMFLDKKCSEIDSLMSDIQQQIDTLEQYKKSVITEAVTKGLNPDVQMKDSRIDYIDKYPSTWKLRRLKYVLKERNERSSTGNEELLSVSQYKGVIPSSENANRTMQANTLIGYKKVYTNDLVFNKLNPVLARFGKSEYNGITSPDYAVYIVNNNYFFTKFLEYILKTDRYSKEYGRVTLGVGDGYTRLYTNQLGCFYVAAPPIEEQNKILLYLDKMSNDIESIISTKQIQLNTLENYKKSLIYEYVTGKKEVPNE